MKFTYFGAIALFTASALLSSCEQPKEKVEEKKLPLVKTEEVKNTPFEHKIRIQGNIQTDQDLLINSETGGKLVEVNVKEGQKIKKDKQLPLLTTQFLLQTFKNCKHNWIILNTYCLNNKNCTKKGLVQSLN